MTPKFFGLSNSKELLFTRKKKTVSWFYRKTVWVININLGEITIQMCYKNMRLDDILDWGRRVRSRAQMEGVT